MVRIRVMHSWPGIKLVISPADKEELDRANNANKYVKNTEDFIWSMSQYVFMSASSLLALVVVSIICTWYSFGIKNNILLANIIVCSLRDSASVSRPEIVIAVA
jgi:uncharacterized membrane protein